MMPPANRRASISVFFPAYNDEVSIAPLVRDAIAVLETLTDDYEVIVINDGSADATPRVLDELARGLPHVEIIHHETNKGYGAALRTGFNAASKDLVFYTDGDGQYDVRELVNLFPLMTGAVDVVNGYKIKRADKRHRILIGSIYKRTARFLFRLPIRDVDCDFRLLRQSALRRIELVSSSGVIGVELVRKLHAAGCVFVESPVHHYLRAHSQSQFFRPGRVAHTALDFLVLWLKLFPLRWLSAASGDDRGAGAELLTPGEKAQCPVSTGGTKR
ncbi:MAG: glycosyltransferase family 2 protein [Acidobacteria bacterium]|nr:glycosyltransferase family 2 protein [Acidobacteriota bacterium]